MSRKIIKYFDTNEYEFVDYTLSNFTLSSNGAFSFLPGQNIATLKTPIFNPEKLIKILMIQVMFDENTHAKIAHDINYLAIEVGLFDSDGDIYFDGSNWVSGSAYNTIDDFLDNIQTYQYNYAKGVGLRLRFTRAAKDNKEALLVRGIKMLCNYDFNYKVDVLHRSLRAELEAITARSRTLQRAFSGSSVDFGSFNLKETYRNAIPTHVFNYTDDPNLVNNLFSSYNSVTKQITLSETLSSKNIVVYFNYNPVVHIWTSTEYKEVALLPYICVEDIVAHKMSSKSFLFNDTIIDYYNDAGYELPSPHIKNYEFQLGCEASSNFDVEHLTEALETWSENTYLLRLLATDSYVDISQESGFDDATFPGFSDMRRNVARFLIQRVPEYLGSAKAIKPVSSIEISASSGSSIVSTEI